MKRNQQQHGIVEVGSVKLAKANDTLTIGTGAAHSAQDVVSTDAGEILAFTFADLEPGQGARIKQYLLTLDQNAVFSSGGGYDLHLFSSAPTAQATNAAFDVAAVDLAKYIGKVALGTLVDVGSSCVVGGALDWAFVVPPTRTLYGKLVALAGETTVTGKTLSITLFAQGN